MKSLVVYFSRKGYVKNAAVKRAEKLGADLAEIKTSEPVKGVLGFWWCGRYGMHRWGMPIEPLDIDIGSYDKIVICSPVWVFSVAAPIRSFINNYAGQIREVDYILVHFSFPVKYDRTINEMDSILGVKHSHFTSICCMWGKFLKVKEL